VVHQKGASHTEVPGTGQDHLGHLESHPGDQIDSVNPRQDRPEDHPVPQKALGEKHPESGMRNPGHHEETVVFAAVGAGAAAEMSATVEPIAQY
jgi:hypothetical protein